MKATFKQTLAVLTAAFMLICIMPAAKTQAEPEIWDGSIATAFAGGSGTENDPYLISNGAELALLAQQVNDGWEYWKGIYIKLTSDIYLNETANWKNWETNPPLNKWTPIGSGNYGLKGNFDGDGHSVFGVYINKTGTAEEDNNQGLFGCIKGYVVNLGVEKSYIKGNENVGGVGGRSEWGGVSTSPDYAYIICCHNSGIVKGNKTVGGLIGYSRGQISESYNIGNVNGDLQIGGVAGYYDGFYSMDKCYNTGSINGVNYVGGISGYTDSRVSYSYNTGNVSGNKYIGGITGLGDVSRSFNSGNISGESNTGGITGSCCCFEEDLGRGLSVLSVDNCYNTGNISGKNAIGGITGSNIILEPTNISIYNGSIENCYNIGNVTGSSDVGAITGKNKLTAPDNNVYKGEMENCYYLSECLCSDSSAVSLTSSQMQNVKSYEGFAFIGTGGEKAIWTMNGNPNYPYAELMDNNHVESVPVHTAAPTERPTSAPVKPTSAPVKPTSAPVKPTDKPLNPPDATVSDSPHTSSKPVYDSSSCTNPLLIIFIIIVAVSLIALVIVLAAKRPADRNEVSPDEHNAVPPAAPDTFPPVVPGAFRPSGSHSRAAVVGVAGMFNRARFDISNGTPVSFGRDPKRCKVVFNASETAVSRVHCIVTYVPSSDNYLVKDSSKNGVFIGNMSNKMPSGSVKTVPHGTVIYLGSRENAFRLE